MQPEKRAPFDLPKKYQVHDHQKEGEHSEVHTQEIIKDFRKAMRTGDHGEQLGDSSIEF